MKKHRQSHTLIDTELDDSGAVDKYREFGNSDFSNSFKKLEEPDYEIRATEKDKEDKQLEEENMKGTRKNSSYIGQLSSGYDAKVQDDYQAGNQKGQAGKAETEEVTEKANWKNDKRDAIGRAASTLLKRTAAHLDKLAKMYEDEEDFEDVDLDLDDDDVDEELEVEATDEATVKAAAQKEADHPIDHDPKKDDPDANQSSQTGDEEWVDIGPGTFKDKRDGVGRADDNE